MIGRILRSVDFERVLGRPICARSVHFAVHFLAGLPSRKVKPASSAAKAELSTAVEPLDDQAVDDSPRVENGIWLGSVVPKRHARRAVTRALLKRQIRHAVNVQAGLAGLDPVEATSSHTGLTQGLWVVRLCTPFDKQKFPSASSEALRLAAAEELGALLGHAARRVSA